MTVPLKIRHDAENVNSVNVGERKLLVAVLHRALIDLLEIGNKPIDGKKIDLHLEENMYSFLNHLSSKRIKIGSTAAGPEQRQTVNWFLSDNDTEMMSFNYILRTLELEPVREKIIDII